MPDVGSTWLYQCLLGSGRATALTLLGDKLPADKAAAWGLVWDCVGDAELMPRALATARQLACEAERQRMLIDRPEFAEGVAAFPAKRPPTSPPR